MVRKALVILALLAFRTVARLFFRFDLKWIGDVPEDPWHKPRLSIILNHTSLYDVLLAGLIPFSYARRLASRGVVPIADKTAQRPLTGRFFKMMAYQVVSITRQRDHTWKDVLSRVDEDAMIVMLPEGRMKRANGLDLYGRPMTVRAGIADVLEAIPEGSFQIFYNGGLHHVQHPGETLPRLFKTIHVNAEVLRIEDYRAQMQALAAERGCAFRHVVVEDLQRRRDESCPPEPPYKPSRQAKMSAPVVEEEKA